MFHRPGLLEGARFLAKASSFDELTGRYSSMLQALFGAPPGMICYKNESFGSRFFGSFVSRRLVLPSVVLLVESLS